MTANAEIVLEEHPNSLIVPEAAISYDAQRKNAVRRRARRRGAGTAGARCRSSWASATARRTEMLDGVKQGDRVLHAAVSAPLP